MTTTIYGSGRGAHARKDIKTAAQQGGEYHVQVDMRPTDAYEVDELCLLAGGATTRDVESWRNAIRERESASARYERPASGRQRARDFGYADQAQRLCEAGPSGRYVRDLEYEARMAAWAATFTTRAAVAA